MAFLEEELTEEEQQQQGAVQAGPATIGANDPVAGQKAPVAAGGGSGTFTNLQQYIDANKPKAQELSNQITSGIEGQAGQLRTDLTKQREQNLGAQSQLGQEGQRLAGGQQFVSSTLQQAGRTPFTQEQQQQFEQIRQGQGTNYQAPTLAEEQKRAEELKRRSDQFGTAQGRQEELQRTIGGQSPTYSAGQRGLDELLLGGDRNLRTQSIRRAREATAGLGGQLNTLQGDIQSTISDQAAKRQALQNFAKTQLEQGVGDGIEGDLYQRGYADIEADLKARQTADLIKRQQQNAALREAAASGVLTTDQLAQLGLEAGQRVYGLSDEFGQFIRDPQKATLSQIAQSPEIARYQALQALAGRTGGISFDPSQVGKLPGVGYDETGLKSALAQRQQAFESAFTPKAQELAQRQQAIKQYNDYLATLGDTRTIASRDAYDQAKQDYMDRIGQILGGLTPAERAQIQNPFYANLSERESGRDRFYFDPSRVDTSQVLSPREQQLRDLASQYEAFDVAGKDQVTQDQAFQDLLSQYGYGRTK